MLAEVEASGVDASEWARREGVDARSLNMWRLNLARRSPAPRLVELVAATRAAAQPPVNTRYVVRRGEFAVEFGGDFEQDTLFRILEVVAAC
jgi:hypothetical protein